MMEKIQEQAWSLWSDFLHPEFGFTRQSTFKQPSQGTGDSTSTLETPSLLHLDSNARREIVNYITGIGIDVQSVMSGPNIGWSERIDIGFEDVIDTLSAISSNEKNSQLVNDLHSNLKFRNFSCSKELIKKLASESTTGDRIR